MFARQAAGGRYPVPRRFCPLFLPGMPPGHLPRRIWGVLLPGRRLVSHSAQEMIPFSARNRLGAPSAQEFGRFSAREAVGVLFRAGFAAFSCLQPPRSTFCAGFRVFSCSAGGWYPLPRRKCYLFLLQMPPGHPQRRIWGIFLPGRRVVSRSAQEKCSYSVPRRMCRLPGGPARRSRVNPAARRACLTVPLLQ